MASLRIACVGLCAIFLAASAAVAEPVAFVVAIKGNVNVTPAGSKGAQKAVLGRPLERGDRVQVGKAGSASLFFSDGNLIELGEQSSVTVGGKVASGSAAKVGPGSDLSGEVFLKVSRFIKGDSKQSGMIALAPMRGGPDESTPVILTPRRTAIRTDRPEFHWREVPGATHYRVVVAGDEGELWRLETTATTLAFPTDAPPLAAGAQYLIELTALGESGRIRTEETVFSVMTTPESRLVGDHLTSIDRASREGAPEAAHYLAGSYLVGQGLYSEAISHFEALCRLDSEAPGPHEALGNVYRTVGLTDLAAAELQKALELTRVTSSTP